MYIFFLLSLVLLMSYLRNQCLIQSHKDFCLSSKSGMVLALTCRSLIHVQLTFCISCERGVQFHSSACVYPVTSAAFIERLFFPH